MVTPTRDFYISGREAVLAHENAEHGIEIYYYNSIQDKPCALFFAGKAQEPMADYYYNSTERREAAAIAWSNQVIKLHEERKKAKPEKR